MIWAMTALNAVLTVTVIVIWFDTKKRNEEMKWLLRDTMLVLKACLKKIKR